MGTRTTGGDLSWEARFVSVWPEVRRRVVGLVVHRGAAHETAEDVAQEVAVRAYHAMPTFSSADELFWWCSTVARRLVIDDHRKHERVSTVAEPPETVDERDDPQGSYERRQLVRAVLEQFALLPAAQQAAVMQADNANDYVRRHRARRRLLAVVEAFGAAVAALWRRARITRHALPVLATVTIAAVLLDTVAVTPSTRPPREDRLVTEPSVAPSPRDPAASASSRPAPADAASLPRRGLTIDPPVKAAFRVPTPVGEVRTGVREAPPRAPLDCLRLGSIGQSFCIDYPRLP